VRLNCGEVALLNNRMHSVNSQRNARSLQCEANGRQREQVGEVGLPRFAADEAKDDMI
jgi:hypothetical protein